MELSDSVGPVPPPGAFFNSLPKRLPCFALPGAFLEFSQNKFFFHAEISHWLMWRVSACTASETCSHTTN
jgi:hypothetical protein